MPSKNTRETLAQVLMPTSDLSKDIEFFSKIGFRLDNIFPADDPAVALMSGHGLNIRLDKDADCMAPVINILSDEAEYGNCTAPNGTHIKIVSKAYKLQTPLTRHKFEVRQLEGKEPWVIGRAGMLYRDLIPDRLGGGIIASHIRIPEGGPVPDMVHYHTIGFQLIFCIRGWVRLVYEDQGPPFILHAGECVTQPPEIRHRVLEASDNLEVVEIGVPAEHMTTIDHDMQLPNELYNPEREFQGQRFCHHQLKDASWSPWKVSGLEYRDTGINEATKGVASVHVIRVLNHAEESQMINHNADILFSFIKEGEMTLKAEGFDQYILQKGGAFVIPPGLKYMMSDFSNDFELIEVSLPGDFKTTSIKKITI
jgi:quercetin dioxygenase-like cupin family protein